MKCRNRISGKCENFHSIRNSDTSEFLFVKKPNTITSILILLFLLYKVLLYIFLRFSNAPALFTSVGWTTHRVVFLWAFCKMQPKSWESRLCKDVGTTSNWSILPAKHNGNLNKCIDAYLIWNTMLVWKQTSKHQNKTTTSNNKTNKQTKALHSLIWTSLILRRIIFSGKLTMTTGLK